MTFQIAKMEPDDPERGVLLHHLYAFIGRRALAGLTPKNYNHVFQTLAEHFIKHAQSLESLVEFFADRTGDSTRYPSDEEVQSGAQTTNIYMFAPGERTRDILWELEKASRPKYAKAVDRPDSLWTEHVMPHAWGEDWPLPDGGAAR